MNIDSHHHFWHYDPVDYDWIDEPMKLIRRDFLPPHLAETTRPAGIEGVVSVQARQSLAETEWLLKLAAENDFIKGVVGWVNLASPKVADELEHWASNSKLKSVRHVVQGEPDDDFILRPDFNEGINRLREFGLAYDILIFERHLPQTIEFVDRHPEQIFILDHIAKPRIKEGIAEPWRKNICALSERQNVYCKVSGMVTEADYSAWTESQLMSYFDIVLDAFGPNRLMFGSDWPVCLVACNYARWFEIVRRWVNPLSAAEQERVLGGTAIEAYRL